MIEKNEGPFAISNSHFCSNDLGKKPNHQYQAGLTLRNSELVSLKGSTLDNNEISQIGVIGVKGGIQVNNWETGQLYNLRTQNFTLEGNAIEGVGSTQQVFRDSYRGGTDWTTFQTTVNSNNNIWWNGSEVSVFDVPISQLHPFSGWQSVTGQDGLSSWSKPPDPTAACSVTSGKDYWLLVDSPSQTVLRGGSASFNVSLIAFGGLSGTAALSFDGTKEVAGLSGSLSSTSVPLSSGVATFVIKVASGTPVGTYPVTLLATSGSLTRRVTASLVVQ